MGFFKKIFKGVKKVFKKIGGGIKKVAMKVGKFMDKIGIVGQIALMFIPGIGPMLSTMFKGLGGIAATALSAMGPIGAQILKGAQFVIGKAGAYITSAKTAFKTVTQGVSNFVSEFTKTGLKKIGFNPTKFGFKAGGGLDTWVKSGSNSFGEAWGKVSANITENASKILDPFKSSITAGQNTTLKSISDSAFHSVDDIQNMNPQISDWGKIDGQVINLDMDNISNVIQGPSLINKSTIAQAQATASAPSLLSPDTNLLTGEKIVPSIPDSFKGIPYKLPVDDVATGDGGFFDSDIGKSAKGVAASVATTLITDEARSAIVDDPPEAPDYGYVVNAGQTLVQGAGQAVDYGIGAQFIPQSSSPATGLYDGRNTYASDFRALYGATG